jgi:hypothetical protein
MQTEIHIDKNLSPEQNLWLTVVYMTIADYVHGKAGNRNGHAFMVSEDLMFGYLRDCFNGICQSANVAAGDARRRTRNYLANQKTAHEFQYDKNLGKKIMGHFCFKEEAQRHKREQESKQKRLKLRLVKA